MAYCTGLTHVYFCLLHFTIPSFTIATSFVVLAVCFFAGLQPNVPSSWLQSFLGILLILPRVFELTSYSHFLSSIVLVLLAIAANVWLASASSYAVAGDVALSDFCCFVLFAVLAACIALLLFSLHIFSLLHLLLVSSVVGCWDVVLVCDPLTSIC